MRNDKGNFILITVLLVGVLLVSVVDATFSYFGVAMNNSDTTTIEVTSGTLMMEYTDNSTIKNGNVKTGTIIAKKTFTITGSLTGASTLNYQPVLNINKNDYLDGSLVYTLTSVNESNNGTVITSTTSNVEIPTGSNKIILGKGSFIGPVSTGAKHTYTLTITYVGTTDETKSIDAYLSLER